MVMGAGAATRSWVVIIWRSGRAQTLEYDHFGDARDDVPSYRAMHPGSWVGAVKAQTEGRAVQGARRLRMNCMECADMMDRIAGLLRVLCQEGKCRSCGAPVWWGKWKNGKTHPYDPDGKTHFASCPQAREWRAK